MESVLRSLRLARAGFDRRLRAVGADDWGRPTPCSEWDVRLLVNHVVGGDVRAVRLLEGGALSEFVASRDDDVVGSDPVGAWERAAGVLDEVIAQPGALDRPVEYRTGLGPASRVLMARIFDLTVHTWDLARALGVDETLDPDLVAEALDAWATLVEAGVAANPTLFAEPGATEDAHQNPQERLLRACGR